MTVFERWQRKRERSITHAHQARKAYRGFFFLRTEHVHVKVTVSVQVAAADRYIDDEIEHVRVVASSIHY